MRMHNPPHPGSILREDILPALGMGINEAAAALDVGRVTLSRVLNEHAAMSPALALRIEKWLGVENGGSADGWLAMQAAYDLAHARAVVTPSLKHVHRVPKARLRALERKEVAEEETVAA